MRNLLILILAIQRVLSFWVRFPDCWMDSTLLMAVGRGVASSNKGTAKHDNKGWLEGMRYYDHVSGAIVTTHRKTNSSTGHSGRTCS